ncbi:MAG: hypothetical protein EON51_16930 [Acinetobacter sp.]|nr:MAG: hypothetical protein EON51_16930 [Acinetobacter sp.]
MRNIFFCTSKIKKSYCLLFFLCLIALSENTFSQTLSLGLLENVEDNYRRKQLLGTDSTGASFLLRPVGLPSGNGFSKLLFQNQKGNIALHVLPFVLQQQYNSHHPYGMNDNSMVQAKGYQAMLSGGVYFKAGPLSIQLRPELVYAENKAFEGPEDNVADVAFQKAYAKLVYNRIDNPSRFGNGAYSKAEWGQSSIRLNFDPVSFGLSTENLWWGPGIKNSLLMSNNATGFKHLTLNTTRPVDVYIGKIEAQIVAGHLEQSGVNMPTNKLYIAKPRDWRYLSGVSFNYQPKWVPGLYLGASRTFVVYHKDMGNSLSDYLPFFNGINKIKYYNRVTGDDLEDDARRDQYFSAFAKWVMPEAKAEVYLEFGRNDHSVNTRDYALEPEHSRAYVAGFRKLVELKREDEYLELGMEFTQLEAPKTSNVRLGPVWYSHHQVTAGYTNKGQVFGAGIGPGSNMQAFSVKWVKELKSIGFGLDRIVNNNDFFYNAGAPISDVRRHWVDYAFTGKFAWDFKRIILNSEMTYIRSLNYQWRFKDDGSFYWDVPKTDANNIHFKVGLMYRW